jgi:predicted nucleic acid-binding protein
MAAIIAPGLGVRQVIFLIWFMKPDAPLLLDSTVLTDISRQREPSSSWFQDAAWGPNELCVSAVSFAEYFAGLRPEQRSSWREFISNLTHLDVTKDIAVRAGIFRFELARQGRILLIPDALIAAKAIAHRAILVTANIKDFPVSELPTNRPGG